MHPTELGYAIVANEWIRLMNANGGSLPEVDLLPFTGISAPVSRSSVVPHTAWEFTPEAYASLLLAFPPLDRP